MSMPSLEPYRVQGRSPFPAPVSSSSEDERWRVKLSSDDVKLMTVDQLDDAYRLSIVDLETEVWKPGMGHWQPLGAVLGEDGEASPPPAPRSPPPPRLIATVLPPRAETVAPSFVPLSAVPSFAPPAPSAPPVAMSVAPMPEFRPRSGGFGRALLAVACIGGALLSLYRNDVLLDAANALHQKPRYMALEARVLGGPSFGMTRALDLGVPPTAHVAAVVAPTLIPTIDKPAAASAPIAAASLETPPRAVATVPAAKPVHAPVVAPKKSAVPRAVAVHLSEEPEATPKKSKSATRASRASEYDPLNPNL